MHNPFEHAFNIRIDERVEVRFINDTDMWHPMHVHGRTSRWGLAAPGRTRSLSAPGKLSQSTLTPTIRASGSPIATMYITRSAG